jgi:hypothetical protein
MNNPGIALLGDFAITAAGSFVGDWITDLDGMLEADLFCHFGWGSGGTTLKTWFQTSLDQGNTAIDLWCVAATTAAKTRAVRIKPDGVVNTPTDGALADDTIATGLVLGDRLRVKYVVTGTYGGSSLLTVRASVR